MGGLGVRAFVTDVFSRRIVGWQMASHLCTSASGLGGNQADAQTAPDRAMQLTSMAETHILAAVSQQNPTHSAPCFRESSWTMVPDPMRPASDDDIDHDWTQALEENGFTQWARIGGTRTLGAVPLLIEVYRRDAGGEDDHRPRFMMEIRGNIDMSGERAYAQDLPELMQVLRQWTAIAQQAATVQLIAALPSGPDGYNESAQPDLVALLRTGLAAFSDGLLDAQDRPR
jgi:hypothetical protein